MGGWCGVGGGGVYLRSAPLHLLPSPSIRTCPLYRILLIALSWSGWVGGWLGALVVGGLGGGGVGGGWVSQVGDWVGGVLGCGVLRYGQCCPHRSIQGISQWQERHPSFASQPPWALETKNNIATHRWTSSGTASHVVACNREKECGSQLPTDPTLASGFDLESMITCSTLGPPSTNCLQRHRCAANLGRI